MKVKTKRGKSKGRIDIKRLNKYLDITKKALNEAKKAVNSKRKKQGMEILSMASSYYEDGLYFKKQGDYVNAFACINYAHGWLDAGSRLGIFCVKNNKIFVVK